MTPTTKDAYKLFHDGSLVFARMEENGIAVDVPYLKATVKSIGEEMATLTADMKSDEVWKVWHAAYGEKSTLNSRPQLADVIFKRLGHPARARTESGDKDSTEESAFRGINLPFIGKYFRLQKLQKLRSTYFKNILREQCDGVLHPSFNLHTVQTYRSSSSEPNFQNVPTRDPVLGKMIRQAFVPRPGNHLVEVDLAGAEVRVAYCYHLDTSMEKYLLDPSTDMHRDTAAELLCLPVEFLIKHKDWAKRTVRDWAKNRFVFPQFYGSVFFQCAPHIWEALLEETPDGKPKYTLPDGTGFIDHMASQGITSLGACDPKQPAAPGTFEYHVARVQKSFWEIRFPVYTEWKNRWLKNYQARGYFDLLTGFRCHGLYRRNQVINYPVQGAAFHIELLACVLMQRYIDRYRMKSLLIGQIHDSILADVPPDELQDYLSALKHVITVTIPKKWPWITICLEIEAEVVSVGESWAHKRVWVESDQEWKERS